MNDFQGGVTANDLSPQTYKNSYQNSGMQATLDSEGVQSDNLNQSINTLPVSENLKVVGPTSSTLGVSTQSVNQPQSSTNFIPFILVAVVISAVLTVYFFRNFSISFAHEDE